MDKQNSNGGFDWQDAQRRYLEAFAAFGKTGAGTDPLNPWGGALDYWWKSVAPAAVGGEQAVFANLVNQSKTFFDLADRFGKMMTAAAQGKDGDWQAIFNQHLESMKAGLGGAAPGPQPLGAFWQLPLDTWERTLSSLTGMPGDMFRGFGAAGGPARLPVIPGIGYTKEKQDRLQHGTRLWIDYQRELAEYNALLSKAGVRAIDILRERVTKLGIEGGKIRSLREIYNLWVDCNEDAFAELAYSKAYSEQYGRMVNALMAFKRHAQGLVDDCLAALDLPTRGGIDTMQKRQAEIRRDLRVAEEHRRADAEAIEKLKQELEALKREMRMASKARPDSVAAAENPRSRRRPARGESGDLPAEAPE